MLIRTMRLSLLFMFLAVFKLSAGSSFAQARVTVELENATLGAFFETVRSQTGNVFVYSTKDVDTRRRVDVTSREEVLTDLLDRVLGRLGLSYHMVDNYVVVRTAGVARQQPAARGRTVAGLVTDQGGAPLRGAIVVVREHTSTGTATDARGRFSLTVPADARALVVSYIGMDTRTIELGEGAGPYDVTLNSSVTEIEAVTVEAGIMQRDAATFAGSYTQVSQLQLKEAGTYSVLDALSLYDPSFVIVPDDMAGSDPNALPNIEINGKTSLNLTDITDEYAVNPNLPHFVIDGFDATLARVNDLDINRVASITILKDAGATAIYGAKGANGVVVINLVKPKRGEFMVNYSANGSLSFADLGVFNMMNAREKLEFEKLAGFYNEGSVAWDNPNNDSNYWNIHRLVERGTDTYWLKYPLRTGLSQQHYLSVSGGDGVVNYQAHVRYSNRVGVMKGQGHENFDGGVYLQYRRGGLNASNDMSLGTTNSRNGSYGSFADWVNASPYYKPWDDEGNLLMNLNPFSGSSVGGNFAQTGFSLNPMWDAMLDSDDAGTVLDITNNTRLDYTVRSIGLRVSSGLSLARTANTTEVFTDPRDSRFRENDWDKKGSFSYANGNPWRWSANIAATMSRGFDETHYISFMVRASADNLKRWGSSYLVEGLPEGARPNPSQGKFIENSSPSYHTSLNRNVTFMGTFNYNFKQRYSLDLTYNRDGSTTFGKNNPFTTNWSAGLLWNIHREPFAAGWTWTNNLALRGSFGTNANQNTAGLSSSIYRFINGADYFGQMWSLSQFANPDLDWTKTDKISIGLNVAMLEGRLNMVFDLYRNHTDPLVYAFSQPPSVGVSNYDMNLGELTSKGWTANVIYAVMRRPEDRALLSVRATVAQGRQTYGGFGNAFERLNAENLANENNMKKLQRFRDGADADALWAVRSLGIDPATGREVFLSIDGTPTFVYNSDDEVEIGTSRAIARGNIGVTFNYKHFRSSLNFGYSFGGRQFNNALFTKVENILTANILNNQDKRALYERWQKPGDVVQFKGIHLNEYTRISSRFIQKENFLDATAIQVGWDFYDSRLLEITGLKSLVLNLAMNDLFRISSVRRERGIYTPYARDIRFSLTTNF
jgi:TonB-linked SusC/RagA family outer membrane protein